MNTGINPAALFSLPGRRALVTGGNSGIGEAMARALGAAGARVLLLARREAELQAAAERLRGDGLDVQWLAADLCDVETLHRTAMQAEALLGGVDILVNAAGVNIRKPMLELAEADWDATMRINLEAPFFLAQKLAPAMIERRWGRILNISSLQSVRAFNNSGPYGASKGGIAQLTRAQAEAWSKHGVNANAIAPGFFATPLTAPVVNDPARWQAMADKTFIGRNGALADLAGTAIYLCSPASDYVTGQTIFVDGGFSAG